VYNKEDTPPGCFRSSHWIHPWFHSPLPSFRCTAEESGEEVFRWKEAEMQGGLWTIDGGLWTIEGI